MGLPGCLFVCHLILLLMCFYLIGMVPPEIPAQQNTPEIPAEQDTPDVMGRVARAPEKSFGLQGLAGCWGFKDLLSLPLTIS